MKTGKTPALQVKMFTRSAQFRLQEVFPVCLVALKLKKEEDFSFFSQWFVVLCLWCFANENHFLSPLISLPPKKARLVSWLGAIISQDLIFSEAIGFSFYGPAWSCNNWSFRPCEKKTIHLLEAIVTYYRLQCNLKIIRSLFTLCF